MKAVVRRGPSLVVDTLAAPEPAAGQVLVKTLACGICGSDLHAVHHMEQMVDLSARSGEPGLIDPKRDIVFGHEFCAELLDHGPGTDRRLRPGTRVVAMPVAPTPQGFDDRLFEPLPRRLRRGDGADRSDAAGSAQRPLRHPGGDDRALRGRRTCRRQIGRRAG
ncbi:alcohol dehydrogenase catalytic domain-containing protein [Sphingomonas sp. MMS24-JH45]